MSPPIAWYFMDQWLQDFIYRMPFSIRVSDAAAISPFCIALLTVSFQAIKAALAKPVKSLRSA
jgi:putative ABC transport system permease protein